MISFEKLNFKTTEWKNYYYKIYSDKRRIVKPNIDHLYLELFNKHNNRSVGSQRFTIWNGSFYNTSVINKKIFEDNFDDDNDIFYTLIDFYNLNFDKVFKSDKLADSYPKLTDVLNCPPVHKIIFFNITKLSKPHRGKDLGLYCKYNTIKLFGNKNTLLLNYPAPAANDNRHPFLQDSSKDALRKHWSKIGFRQYKNSEYFYIHLGKHKSSIIK